MVIRTGAGFQSFPENSLKPLQKIKKSSHQTLGVGGWLRDSSEGKELAVQAREGLRFLIPNIYIKVEHFSMYPVILILDRDGGRPRACWLASPAKSVSSSFSEGSYLKNKGRRQ